MTARGRTDPYFSLPMGAPDPNAVDENVSPSSFPPPRALASIIPRAFRSPARRGFHAFSYPPRRGGFSRARGDHLRRIAAHLAPPRASNLPPSISLARVAGAHPVRARARREDRPQHREDESPRPSRSRRSRRLRPEHRQRLRPRPPQEPRQHRAHRPLPHRPPRSHPQARQLQR